MKANLTNLLGLKHLSKDDILFILDQAKQIKHIFSKQTKQSPTLRGKTFVNLFFEPSTRTRVSFEMAVKLLGASSINISPETSSFTKGESIYDTVKNLQSMGIDGIILRHPHAGTPDFIAQHLDIPVINAGDGYTEHPTQGLLDLFTMRESCGDIEGKRVMILGDILHSRVARSNIYALIKCGAEVTVCGPPTLIPADIKELGVYVSNHIDQTLHLQDFINVLRIQYERQDMSYFPSIREYRSRYALTEARQKQLKDDVVILHPGPINRGIEIDSVVADGSHNVILDQVTNGIAVRMAVLYLLTTGKGK